MRRQTLAWRAIAFRRFAIGLLISVVTACNWAIGQTPPADATKGADDKGGDAAAVDQNGPPKLEFHWLTDLNEGKRVAAARDKDLLIVFSGLPWDEPSKQLERGTLKNDRVAVLTDKYVLVRLDFPNDGMSLPQEGTEPKEPDKSWRGVYGIYSYPTVLLTDATGRPYAMMQQIPPSPTQFVRQIIALSRYQVRRDTAFAKAAKAEGIEKAKDLAEGLLAVRTATRRAWGSKTADLLLRFYSDEIDTVVRLDADGKAGLKAQFEAMRRADANRVDVEAINRLVQSTRQKEGIDAALKLLDLQIAVADSIEASNHFRQSRLTYLELARRYTEALEVARELAADESFRADERLELCDHVAFNLSRLGRFDESISVVDGKLAESADNPHQAAGILRKKVVYLTEAKRDDEVVTTWRQIIPLLEPRSDDWIDAQMSRVQVLAKLGRNDDARAAWEGFVTPEFFPGVNCADTMGMLAHRLEVSGSHTAALEAAARIEKLLETVKPTNEPERAKFSRARNEAARIKALPPKKSEGGPAEVPAK